MAKSCFEIEIAGKGISPETIDWDDLSDLVGSLKEAAVALAEGEGFTAEDEPTFSLVSIEKGSSRLRMAVVPALLTATATISSAIQSEEYQRLPPRSLEALHRLSNKVVARKWTFGFVGNAQGNIAAAMISAKHAVPQPPQQNLTRGTTTVFGRCLRVGGARTPRAEIRLSTGELIHIDVSEKMARELAHSLYEEVGLRGDATWNSDWKLASFRLDCLTGYHWTDPVDAFDKLAAAAGGHWQDVDAQEFASNVRYGEGQ